MSHPPHLLANRPASPARKRPGRSVASLLLVAGLTVSAMTALAASPASAASVCAPGADTCVITDAVQTPLGPVTIAVSAANVVTVQLTPDRHEDPGHRDPIRLPAWSADAARVRAHEHHNRGRSGEH